MAQPCRFIYFDAGFTLLHPHPSVGFHYAAIAAKYHVHIPAAQIDAAFVGAWKAARNAVAPHKTTGAPAYGSTRAEALTFWTRVIRLCFRDQTPDDPQFYEDLFDHFAKPECWRLYNDVPPALALLEERGIPFGVISNWDSRLRPLLDGLGILPKLSALILSSEAGYEKPHPNIYHTATNAVPEPLRNAIGLIGDEPEADGTAPLAAGWQQCLIQRSAKPTPAGLRTMPDLPAAVRALT